MRIAAFLILSFILSFSAQAQQNCTEVFAAFENSPSGSFQALSYHFQLLRQSDPRLEKLLDEESGFCGMVCAVNVSHAFTDFMGYNPKITSYKPMRRLERLIAIWEKMTGLDAGGGTNLAELAVAVKWLNAERDQFRIRTRVTYRSSENSIAPPPNGLVILGVETGNDAGHALVALKVDKKNKKVLIADPNYPDHLEWMSYHVYTDAEGVNWIKLHLPTEVFGFHPMAGFVAEQMVLTADPIL